MTGAVGGSHLALVGTTASGKSALALAWAQRAGDVEIVSVDSMQVYRGMAIGTASPSPADRALVPHHLVDLVEPHVEFTVADHQAAARAAIAEIEQRGRRALLVGGTALHLRAIVDDLDLPGRYPHVRTELEAEPDTAALHERLTRHDPAAAGRIEPGNRRRILRALEVTLGGGRPFSSFGPGLDRHPPTTFRLIGLWLPRAVVRRRIEARYRAQMAVGFLDEVRRLSDRPLGVGRTASQALGYRELLAHLDGRCTRDEALQRAIGRTRRFARRQRMWFRRDPRIRWLAVAADPAPLAEAAVLESVP
jgi:tRNA dimethylallyltransferase